MKLLRIETFNLNSLYGEHSIDLQETLGGASLFLIHGPTGSGKSTLMDAVSLALFGQTPRLNADRTNDTTDPAAIMSRGTGECSAEVVFSKLDAGVRRTYRARWACRRARKKPDGKLQTPVRSIERLEANDDWEVLVSSVKKKDFAPVLDEVLDGFTVQDFNRSMLLAQGQFDAFLGAPSADRAAILERLTDTSVYQEIGERASRMQREHSERIRRLQRQVDAGGGLDAVALVQLEEAHAEHGAELARQALALGQAEEHLGWFDGDVAFQTKLRETAQQLVVFEEELRTAADGLALLAEHERCAEVEAFPLMDADASARKRLASLEADLEAAAKSLPALEAAATTRHQAAVEALAKRKRAEEELEVLRPLVAQADQAVSGHDEVTKRVEAGAKRHRAANERHREAADAVALATAALGEAKGGLEAAKAEFEAHRGDAAFVTHWESLRTRLDRLVAAAEAVTKDHSALEGRQKALSDERSKLTTARSAHDASYQRDRQPIQEALEVAKVALTSLLTQPDFEASREEADAAIFRERDQERRVRDALVPVTDARKSAAALTELRNEIRLQAVQLKEAEGAHEVSTRRVEGLAALAGQAQGEWERIDKLAGLVTHRAGLVGGEPCSLCGSEVHPWADDPERQAADAVIDETVAAAAKRRDEARSAHGDAQEDHSKTDRTARALATEARLLKGRESEAAETQGALDGRAAVALEAVALPREGSVADVTEAIAEASGRVRKAEQTLAALTEAGRAVTGLEQKLRQMADREQVAEGELREQGAKTEARGQQLASDRAAHEMAREALVQQSAECRASYEEHGGRAEGDDPAGWREAGDRRRRDHEARGKAVADQQSRVESASAGQKGKEELLADRKADQEREGTALRALEADRDDKAQLAGSARATLTEAWARVVAASDTRPRETLPPDGMAPPEQLELQKSWATRAVESEGKAREAERAAQRALGDARAAIKEQQKSREEQGVLCGEAHTKLRHVLDSLSLVGADALAKCRLGSDVLAEERARRKRFDAQRVELETLLRERTKQSEDHARVRPKGLGDEAKREDLAEHVIAAKALHEHAKKAHQATGDQHRDHQRAQKASEENRKKLRAAEDAARVWQTLHDLIGVNAGAKFKEFAQALNLGQLLTKANVHLRRLSTRYLLVPRVVDGLPTLDFALEDLWQGNDHVAPRSLSGGERFLVSLALALGLSDFRTVKMPIETVLLDEGFGTLDPDTLSVALGALSQLQADGRQVGIISHVVGLEERIEVRIEVKPLGGGRSEVRVGR